MLYTANDSGGCILCWWRVCLVLLGSMHVRQPSGATGESLVLLEGVSGASLHSPN